MSTGGFHIRATKRQLRSSLQVEAHLAPPLGPKGFIDSGKVNFQKQLQSKKFDQEARKLWFFCMRNEVIQELQEKGFDVE